MFTKKEDLQKLRSIDRSLAIWLWHEETLASMQARLLSIKKELDWSDKRI